MGGGVGGSGAGSGCCGVLVVAREGRQRRGEGDWELVAAAEQMTAKLTAAVCCFSLCRRVCMCVCAHRSLIQVTWW